MKPAEDWFSCDAARTSASAENLERLYLIAPLVVRGPLLPRDVHAPNDERRDGCPARRAEYLAQRPQKFDSVTLGRAVTVSQRFAKDRRIILGVLVFRQSALRL
jgi:hypothetical protein